jgi:Flp pilus assembly protein TadG
MTSHMRCWRSERGSELIEMAMVTPILMLMLAGIFDFGFLFRSWEVVTNAAREGARVGVLPAYSCDAATPDDIQSRVDAYMAAAGIDDATSYEVTVDNVDVPTTAGTFTGCAVLVELTQPLPSLSVIGDIFGGNFGTVAVAAAAVMRAETQAAPPAP